jgi:Transglutaminase-like superfamily
MKSSLSSLWIALRLAVWLCLLPLRLRVYTLPVLLHRLTQVRRHPISRNRLELYRAIGIAVRLCHLRLFHFPLFPRACLRQALVIYYVLTRMGYPAEIHFGARKEGEQLHGHSWVTLQGRPVAERTRTGIFTTVYSYPSTACAFSQGTRNR